MTKDVARVIDPGLYAMTHCRHCAAGWTRRTAEGGTLIVCLLDRELVLVGLTDCDRYAPRDSGKA